MTKGELLYRIIGDNWLDFNNLVKPQKDMHDSDNGVLFTSIAQILSETDAFQQEIEACYKKPGLLNRRPNDSSSLEQWDDYLGRAIACIYSRNTKEAREILLYGVTHLFFFNNTDTFTFKAWLGRAFIIWPFMFCAAFPILKWLMYPILTLYCSFFKPDNAKDGNGIQLQWLQVMGHKELYGSTLYNKWYSKFKNNTDSVLSIPFTDYYEENHPFVLFIKENLD